MLNLITIILSIAFFLIYRKIQYQIYEDIEKEHQTQDDFKLLIENIPILDFKIGQTIQDKHKIQFDY
jgi:hypothetical protein